MPRPLALPVDLLFALPVGEMADSGDHKVDVDANSVHTDEVRVSSSTRLPSDDDVVAPVVVDHFSNMRHWVCCICIVTFDLELGQAIEVNRLKSNSNSYLQE